MLGVTPGRDIASINSNPFFERHLAMAIKFALKDQNINSSDVNAGKAEPVVKSRAEPVGDENSGMDRSEGGLFADKSPPQNRKRKK